MEENWEVSFGQTGLLGKEQSQHLQKQANNGGRDQGQTDSKGFQDSKEYSLENTYSSVETPHKVGRSDDDANADTE